MGPTSKGKFTIVHQIRLRSFLLPVWFPRVCRGNVPLLHAEVLALCASESPSSRLCRGQCSSVAVSFAHVLYCNMRLQRHTQATLDSYFAFIRDEGGCDSYASSYIDAISGIASGCGPQVS